MTENQAPRVSNFKKVTYVDEDNNTILHYAAANDDVEKLKEVIGEENEVNAANCLGWTPLMVATRNGHFKSVKVLIENNANSTLKNYFGYNILFMAIASGNLDLLCFILQHLLSGGISKQSLQNIFSPVSFAILFNSECMVEYLVTTGFCVNAYTSLTEITPLMFADANGNSTIVNYLLQKGAKRNFIPAPKQKKSKLATKRPTSLPPLVIVNQPPSYNPMQNYVNYSPAPAYVPLTPSFSPHISPAAPQSPYNMHQMFFPQNFSPAQIGGGHFMFVPTPQHYGSANNFLSPGMPSFNYIPHPKFPHSC